MTERGDRGARGFLSLGIVLAIVLGVVVLVGAAFAVGRSTAPDTVSRTTYSQGARGAGAGPLRAWLREHRADVVWMRDHPASWRWMREHLDDMPWLRMHSGQWQWLRTHPGSWSWMREHRNDMMGSRR